MRLRLGKENTTKDFKEGRRYCEDCGHKCKKSGKCPKCGYGLLAIRSKDDLPDKQCTKCSKMKYFSYTFCTNCGSKLPENGYEGGTLTMMIRLALEQDPQRREEMVKKFESLGLSVTFK